MDLLCCFNCFHIRRFISGKRTVTSVDVSTLSLVNTELEEEEYEELCNNVNKYFPIEDLKAWYKQFLKEHPDGRIFVEDLEQMFKEQFKEGDPKKVVQEILRIFDTNKSGTLEFREVICAISVMHHGDLNEKLNLYFNLLDIDGSGYIDERELQHILNALYKLVGETCFKIGKDLTAEETAEGIMKKFDTNSDEKLSFEEFQKFITEEEGLARLICSPITFQTNKMRQNITSK